MALLTPGWWQSDWWNDGWWQEDWWLEYGTALPPTPSAAGGMRQRRRARKPRGLSRGVLRLVHDWLELKVG